MLSFGTAEARPGLKLAPLSAFDGVVWVWLWCSPWAGLTFSWLRKVKPSSGPHCLCCEESSTWSGKKETQWAFPCPWPPNMRAEIPTSNSKHGSSWHHHRHPVRDSEAVKEPLPQLPGSDTSSCAPASSVSEACPCCPLSSKQLPYKKLPLVTLRSNLSISSSFCIFCFCPLLPSVTVSGTKYQRALTAGPSLPEAACLRMAACSTCSRRAASWPGRYPVVLAFHLWGFCFHFVICLVLMSVQSPDSEWLYLWCKRHKCSTYLDVLSGARAPRAVLGQSALSALLPRSTRGFCLVVLDSLAELVSGLPACSWECWAVFLKTDCRHWLEMYGED